MSLSEPFLARFWHDLLATAWPPSAPGDSGLLLRRKKAVRGAQLAMMVLVAFAVVGALGALAGNAGPLRMFGLCLVGMAYVIWSVLGVRSKVRRLLGSGEAPRLKHSISDKPWWLPTYFFIQFLLAELLFVVGDRGRSTAVLWLVMLPPVAHAVMLLRWRGVAMVCVTAALLFLVNLLRWHSGVLAQNGILTFLFSVVFTVVFTSIAVGAEESREEVERLASELRRANDALRSHAVQAEELAAARERYRIAREIHDVLGHHLTIVSVQLESAQAFLPTDSARAAIALEQARKCNTVALQEVRRSVSSVRGAPLEKSSLAEAIRQLAEESNASGIEVTFQTLGVERPIASPAQLTLLRAAQEGLTNIHKHARATRAGLRLDFSNPTAIGLEVDDNGVGAAAPSFGFGLIGLRERVALGNGTFDINTAPGRGFQLRLTLPL